MHSNRAWSKNCFLVARNTGIGEPSYTGGVIFFGRVSCLLMVLVGVVLVSSLSIWSDVHAGHSGVGESDPPLDTSLADYDTQTQVSGHLTIAGTDAVRSLMAALVGEFSDWHPDLKIAVQGSRNHGEGYVLPEIEAFVDRFANSRRGVGKTKGHLGSNDIRLLALSRQLSPEEISQFVSRHGYRPIETIIAKEAVALYVHHDNPIDGLTLQQVDALFSKTLNRGAERSLTQWSAVGVNGRWAKSPVHLFGLDNQALLTKVSFQAQALLSGEWREDVKEVSGSASLILAIARDPLAIGYGHVGFHIPIVRPIPIAKKPGLPFILPTTESVMSGIYPLSYPIHLYVNKAPDEELTRTMAEFLTFVNSEHSQRIIVQKGAYPLSALEAQTNLQALNLSPDKEAAGNDERR